MGCWILQRGRLLRSSTMLLSFFRREGYMIEILYVGIVTCGSLVLRNPFERLEVTTEKSVAYWKWAITFLSGSFDCSIKLWDIETGVVCYRTFHHGIDGGISFVLGLALVNSSHFVSVSLDNTAKVWNLSNNEDCLYTFKDHTKTVHDAVFLPEEKVVVTASGDKTVRCWSIDHFLIEEEISEVGSTRSVSVITRTAEEGTEMNNATECWGHIGTKIRTNHLGTKNRTSLWMPNVWNQIWVGGQCRLWTRITTGKNPNRIKWNKKGCPKKSTHIIMMMVSIPNVYKMKEDALSLS